MNEQKEVIDIRMLFGVMKKHIIPVFIAAVLAAVTGFLLAGFIIPKQYTSEALVCVGSSSDKQDESPINTNDRSASRKIADTCLILFSDDRILGELSDRTGGVYDPVQLRNMIKTEPVNDTGMLRISVRTGDPEESCDVADTFVSLCESEFRRMVKNGSISVVSAPSVPERQSFPDVVQFTVTAALIGLAVTYLFFVIKDISDIRVKPDDDLSLIYDLPVFAEIPDFETSEKSGGGE